MLKHRWDVSNLHFDSICLGHTPAFRKLLCSVHQIQSGLPKTVLTTTFGHVVTIAFDLRDLPIFAHMVTLTLDSQMFRNA